MDDPKSSKPFEVDVETVEVKVTVEQQEPKIVVRPHWVDIPFVMLMAFGIFLIPNLLIVWCGTGDAEVLALIEFVAGFMAFPIAVVLAYFWLKLRAK